MTHDSQRIRIQRWLAAGHTITPLQAINRFGCNSLSQRIGEVKLVIPVEREMVKVGPRKRVAKYFCPDARKRA